MKVIRLLKKHHRLGDVISNAAIAVFCGVLICWFEEPVLDCLAALMLGASICAAIAEFSFVKYDEEKQELRDKLNNTIIKLTDLQIELHHYRKELEVANKEIEQLKSSAVALKENPLKSNRIVSDMTFAVRLRGYLLSSEVSDGIGYEEKQYLLRTAEWLIRHQVKTVRRGTEEEKYLERLGLFERATSDGANGSNDGTNGLDGSDGDHKPDGANEGDKPDNPNGSDMNKQGTVVPKKKGTPKNLKKKNTNRKNNKQ